MTYTAEQLALAEGIILELYPSAKVRKEQTVGANGNIVPLFYISAYPNLILSGHFYNEGVAWVEAMETAQLDNPDRFAIAHAAVRGVPTLAFEITRLANTFSLDSVMDSE